MQQEFNVTAVTKTGERLSKRMSAELQNPGQIPQAIAQILTTIGSTGIVLLDTPDHGKLYPASSLDFVECEAALISSVIQG